MDHQKRLLDIIEKLTEWEPYSLKYKIWFNEIYRGYVTNESLTNWLQNHYDYWNQKDREYGNYILTLIRI